MVLVRHRHGNSAPLSPISMDDHHVGAQSICMLVTPDQVVRHSSGYRRRSAALTGYR